ncbi:MAG: hypothetical protein IJZ42_10885 [Lachnospiraceae bacterium]|nr:hypothetical protein [Lachnospiraceae bacterium]
MREYIFCPYCGGITAPGICVNCGMRTEKQSVEANSQTEQNISNVPLQGQPVQNNTYGHTPYSQSGQNSTYGNTSYSQSGQNNMYGSAPYGQPGQNNMYGNAPYGQPGQNNMYGNASYGQSNAKYPTDNKMVYQNEKPKKKSRWWVWLLIFLGILVIGIVIIVIATIAIMASAPALFADGPSSSATPVQTPSVQVTSEYDNTYDEYEMTVYQRELGRVDLSDFDWDSYASSALVYSDTTDGDKDIFLAVDYSSTFGSNHSNHSIDEFSGEYYEPFVDCIDGNQDYGLSRHFIQYSSVKDQVVINGYIAYIQLEGGTVPNEDEINRQILEMTANDLWGHLSGELPYYASDDEVTFMVDSFVTYNDSEKMSILLDVNIVEFEQLSESYIYAINIDLENGTIMDNGNILAVDEDFAAMFREKCCTQNGTDIDGLNYLTDEELADFLVDSDTNIVFYSPYGMEVGYAYETSEYSRGWMTITLSDYEQYLNE